MNEVTNTLIAKSYLESLQARDYSDWAVLCLEQDIDTKNIRILASMYDCNSISEIDTYFRRSLNELGWELPQENECLERYAKSIAQQILDKVISPKSGSRLLYNVYCSFLYLGSENPFTNWGGLLWCYEDLTPDEADSAIIQEAERLINGEKIIFSKNIEEKPLFSEIDKKESFLTKCWRKIF